MSDHGPDVRSMCRLTWRSSSHSCAQLLTAVASTAPYSPMVGTSSTSPTRLISTGSAYASVGTRRSAMQMPESA